MFLKWNTRLFRWWNYIFPNQLVRGYSENKKDNDRTILMNNQCPIYIYKKSLIYSKNIFLKSNICWIS